MSVHLVNDVVPCRWDWHVGEDTLCLAQRVSSHLPVFSHIKVISDGWSILLCVCRRSKLDSEAKKWRFVQLYGTKIQNIIFKWFDFTHLFFIFFNRLFADVLNDIAMFMEILAPYFPACFTMIVCTAGLFKVKIQIIKIKSAVIEIEKKYVVAKPPSDIQLIW